MGSTVVLVPRYEATYYIFIVSFFGGAEVVEVTFTEENQGERVCMELFALNNQVLENQEVFEVSLTSSDPSVVIRTGRKSLVIFDDDCKC